LFYLSKIGNTYYFRLRIPKDVQTYFPTKELRRSLGTSKYKLAKSRVHQFSSNAERIFTMIRSGALSDDQIQRIVKQYLDASIFLHERQRNAEAIFEDKTLQQKVNADNKFINDIIESDEGFDLYTEMLQHDISTKQRQLGRKKAHELPEITRLADMFVRRHCLNVVPGSIEYVKLCNEILRANIQAENIKLEHLNGNYETPYDIEVRNRKKVHTLKGLIDIYQRDKQDSWEDKQRRYSTHRQILHLIGDMPLDKIDRKVCLDFRDNLKEYPKKLQEKDMSIPWRELAKTRSKRLADRTQHFIRTEFCTLLKYAKENDLGVIGSPAKDLAGKKPEATVKKRVPYSTDELQRLVKVLAEVDRINNPEWFWIPLLLLYTGSRSNEICMLRCDDIEQRGNMWVICFRNQTKYSQRTKNKKDRHAPIHNDLIKLGFVDYVEVQRAAGKGRLFDNLKLWRSKWNKRFGNDYNRSFKLQFLPGYTKEQLSEKDLHTFRTTMISWFVQRKDLATIPNISILQSIVGHFEKFEISMLLEFLQTSKLTLVDYGGGFGKEIEQNELLQKLDYGIDFTPLIANSI